MTALAALTAFLAAFLAAASQAAAKFGLVVPTFTYMPTFLLARSIGERSGALKNTDLDDDLSDQCRLLD